MGFSMEYYDLLAISQHKTLIMTTLQGKGYCAAEFAVLFSIIRHKSQRQFCFHAKRDG